MTSADYVRHLDKTTRAAFRREKKAPGRPKGVVVPRKAAAWWPDVWAAFAQVKRAERHAEECRIRRDLLCFIANRHYGASYGWLAQSLDLSASRVGVHITSGRRIADEMGLPLADLARAVMGEPDPPPS